MWPRDLIKSLATDYEDDLARGHEETNKAITMIINNGKLSVIGFNKNNNNFISIKETEYNDGKGILVILNQHTDKANKNKKSNWNGH